MDDLLAEKRHEFALGSLFGIALASVAPFPLAFWISAVRYQSWVHSLATLQ